MDDIETVADAIDAARYAHPTHPRERSRPFSDADSSDREYALRLAHAAVVAQGDGWQPIETAPKDGTKIILYHEKWDTLPIASWEWGEGPEEDGTGGWCAWHTVDDRFPGAEDGIIYPSENYMPSHWRPCPSPSLTNGQGSKA